MSIFLNFSCLHKCSIALQDFETGAAQRIIVLQYDSDSLNRTLQVHSAGAASDDRLGALRLKRTPVDTIALEVDAMKGRHL